jgi:hypothetical protein
VRRSAQKKLYELYCKAMYNTALRIVNDPDEAEDVYLTELVPIPLFSVIMTMGFI